MQEQTKETIDNFVYLIIICVAVAIYYIYSLTIIDLSILVFYLATLMYASIFVVKFIGVKQPYLASATIPFWAWFYYWTYVKSNMYIGYFFLLAVFLALCLIKVAWDATKKKESN